MWNLIKSGIEKICTFPSWIKVALGSLGGLLIFKWLWPTRKDPIISTTLPVTREEAEDRKEEIRADLEAAKKQIDDEVAEEQRKAREAIMGKGNK